MSAPAPRADEGAEPSLHIVRVCELCACGAGGECHVPGCAFWMHDAPTAERPASYLNSRGYDAMDCPECGNEMYRHEGPGRWECGAEGVTVMDDGTIRGMKPSPASSGDGGAPTDPYDTLHMLDVFLALGGTDEEFAEWIDGRAFADAWPQLVAAVAGRIDSLRADSNPPAGVLLKIAERRPAPSPVPEEGPTGLIERLAEDLRNAWNNGYDGGSTLALLDEAESFGATPEQGEGPANG